MKDEEHLPGRPKGRAQGGAHRQQGGVTYLHEAVSDGRGTRSFTSFREGLLHTYYGPCAEVSRKAYRSASNTNLSSKELKYSEFG